MKKILMVALLAIFGLSGCAALNSNVGYALVNQTTNEEAFVAGSGTKTGTACATNILGIVAQGDSSVAAAKKNGRISTIVSVDYSVENYAFVYGKRCTIVHGR